MLTRTQKEEAVSDLSEKLARATSVVVADYRGLAVDDVNALRGRLRSDVDGGSEYHVVKNSLLRLACRGSQAEVLEDHFVGPSAIAISYGDPVSLAKVLVKYSKEHEVFEIKGAVLDGKALDPSDVARLATLPSLDGLRGQLVGLLNAPATKLVRLLKEPGRQLARLAAARRDAVEE